MSESVAPLSPATRPRPSREVVVVAGDAALPDPRAPLGWFGADPIFSAFLEQAVRHPAATAVEWDGGVCTYGQLEKISRSIALNLNHRGIGVGKKIAILAERSPALIYCMLGVLRSGATFYVADAAYPAARLEKCLRRLDPALVLITGDTAVPDEFEDAVADVELVRVPDAVDAALRATRGVSGDDDRLGAVDPANDAYVMFTSGSTGEPKAVVTRHPPLVHFVAWHARAHGLDRADRFSLLSGLSHDPVLRDIFTALSIGATVCVPAKQIVFNPSLLAAWLRERRVTVCHLTPALGEVIASGVDDGGPLGDLRHLFWGGDAVNVKTTRSLREVAPSARQTNFYGATETPQAMASYAIDPDSALEVYPVGRGIDDVQLLLINGDGRRCAVGEVGEIWVRTPYLSAGYQGDASETQAKFFVNPFTSLAGDMCYKTGDLGRYLSDGNVALAGRVDHQLKIRGFRVEPAEVVAAIERVPGVARAIAFGRDVGGHKVLAAWFTVDRKKDVPTAQDVREQLKRELPAYMVPSLLLALEGFPLLPNGKVDFSALPTSAPSEVASGGHVAPETEQERQLAIIWQDVLQLERVGVTDSFLDLGGDSLSSLKVVMRMKKLGVADAVARGILQGRTIRELARGDLPSEGTSSLSPQAQSNLLVNVVRGVLAAIVITEHWLAGFFPALHEQLVPSLGLLFNLATPGFVMVFGISLGYSYYPKYLRAPARTRKSLRVAVGLLGLAIVVGALVKLAVMPLQEAPVTSTAFFMAFFSVLLYYFMALATCGLWFFVISKLKHPVVGCLVLIGAFLLASKVTWMLIGQHEFTGFLYVLKGLFTAKFNYWKMSSAALVGMMAGIALQRRVAPPSARGVTAVGAALMVAAIGLLVGGGGDVRALHHSDDMGLWRWIFCAGGLLVIAGAATAAIQSPRAPHPVQGLVRFSGVFGQLALPLFVLHMMALDFYAIFIQLKLSHHAAVGLTITACIGICGWMMSRMYGLYYGRAAVPAT